MAKKIEPPILHQSQICWLLAELGFIRQDMNEKEARDVTRRLREAISRPNFLLSVGASH
jgi:hypothetical protein